MPEGRTYGRDGDPVRLARGAGQAREGTERIQPLFGITSEARKRERRDFASSLAPSDGEARGERERGGTTPNGSLCVTLCARVGRPHAESKKLTRL